MFNGIDGIFLAHLCLINATVIHNTFREIAITGTINVQIINTSVRVPHDSEVPIIEAYISSSSHTLIINSYFSGIGAAPNAAGSTDPTSHPAVTVLSSSSLYVSGCNFTENSISAVKAYASNITAAGDLTFSNNRAMV